jgi:hypothetical protein
LLVPISPANLAVIADAAALSRVAHLVAFPTGTVFGPSYSG